MDPTELPGALSTDSPTASSNSTYSSSFSAAFPSLSSAAWGIFQTADEVKPSATESHPLMDQLVEPSPEPQAPGTPPPSADVSPFSRPVGGHYRRVSSQDVSTSLRGLQTLAKQGSWRAVVEKVKEAGRGLTPEQHLAFRAYHVLALLKLRMYGAAADELAELGDLDGPDYRFEAYPELYMGRTGSMVPFALRWLHAELPHRVGQSVLSTDRLYALLDYCNRRMDALQAGSPDTSSTNQRAASSPAMPAAESASAKSSQPGTGSAALPGQQTPPGESGEAALGQVFLTPPRPGVPSASPPPPSMDPQGDAGPGGGPMRDNRQASGRFSQGPATAADILEDLLSGVSLGSSSAANDGVPGGAFESTPLRQQAHIASQLDPHDWPAQKPVDSDALSDLGSESPPTQSLKSVEVAMPGGGREGQEGGFEAVFELGEPSPSHDSASHDFFNAISEGGEGLGLGLGKDAASPSLGHLATQAPIGSHLSPAYDRTRPSEPGVGLGSDGGSVGAPLDQLARDLSTDFTAHEDVPAGSGSKAARTMDKWRRRHEFVLHSLVSRHLAQRDFLVALQWLEWLARRRPSDLQILGKYGMVQLQMGDLGGAQATFARVEAIANGNMTGVPPDRRTQAMVLRQRGLLLFALKQYPAALLEFDAALTLDATDAVAANNKALCLMYARDLMGAIKVLEDALQDSPLTALSEALVLNLCSMYELASSSCTDTKRTLSNWIMRLAPDDFDLMCTRL